MLLPLFQRLMNEIFHDFIREGFVVVYLDDVLIFSHTLEEHLFISAGSLTACGEKELICKTR
jgi:hypothetical protein